MQKTNIYFRADGNSRIGLGHIVRSLALAHMLRDEFDCHFFVQNPADILRQQIGEICKTCINLPETTDYVAECAYICNHFLTGNEIVVLDHYGFATDYQQTLKNKGCKVVCIDDMHDKHFVADAVINHAGGVTAADYSAEPYTRFCLGLEYALLRQPFLEAAQKRHYTDRENAVFVCLGGADPHNDTLHVLAHIHKKTPTTHCYLILGSAYLHRAALDNFLRATPRSLTILNNLNAEEMVAVMQRCRYAVTAPSTISYEYLAVGGALYLHQTADNQTNIYNYFIKSGLAMPFATFGADQHFDFAEKQKQLLTGQSKQAYLNFFYQLFN